MFSSQNDKTVAAAAQRNVRSSTTPSIINSDLVLKGNLTSAGGIQVDGQVEGDIRCATLAISDNARVRGEIITEEVTVRGRVNGTIRARKILLTATAHVEGKLRCATFAVEPGAYFEGNCHHCEDPMLGETIVELPSATQTRYDVRSSSWKNSSPENHAATTPSLPSPLGDNLLGGALISAESDVGPTPN